MQTRIRITLPEDGPYKEYKAMIKKENGKLNGVLGIEINKLIKLGLKLKGHPNYQHLPEINSMLDTVSNSAHTHGSCNVNISNSEIENKIQFTKSKKDRAYSILADLMKCFQYKFTQGDFTNAQVKLFGQNDHRTTKSNLELLIIDGCIIKIQMRVGKKNQHKQEYKFVDNQLFAKYNSNEKLEEFTNYFIDSLYSDAYEILYTDIKSKIKEFHGIENDNFTNIRIDYLIEKNILKMVVAPENGNNIYEIIKKPLISENKHKKIIQSNNI